MVVKNFFSFGCKMENFYEFNLTKSIKALTKIILVLVS